MKKRFISLVLAGLMILCALPLAALAQENGQGASGEQGASDVALASSDQFSSAFSFLGYQMRLYGNPAIRSVFRFDAEALNAEEGYSLKEIGILTQKAEENTDFDDLFILATADGYTASEGAQRTVAYGEGADGMTDGVFYAVTEADTELPIYSDAYISRAYAIIAYGEGTEDEMMFATYCNGAGEEEGLGDTVSMLELSQRLTDAYPESRNVLRVSNSQGVDKEVILSTIEARLADARAHFDAVSARYDAWITKAEGYKAQMISYQNNTLKATSYNGMAKAKSNAKALFKTADALFSEIDAYPAEKEAEELESAKELVGRLDCPIFILKDFSERTQDTELLGELEKARMEAEGYYQGLSRAVLEKKLTLSRVKTKISSALTALETYTFNKNIKARMYVLGDSTVCHRAESDKTQGWVDQFIAQTNQKELEVINRASAGWSFKGMLSTVGISKGDTDITHYTDYENGRFQLCLDLAGEGDFIVFASTSPNDLWQTGYDFYYKTDEFGNVTPAVRVSTTEQYFLDENGQRVDLTDANCAQYGYEKYTWKATPNEYYHMLKSCIDRTLAVGATPVLVTAIGSVVYEAGTNTPEFTITRDGVTTNYKIPFAYTNSTGSLRSQVEAYEEVKRILASEYEGKVVLIDPTKAVLAEYKKDFDAFVASGMESTKAIVALRAKYNSDSTDPTHQGLVGASLIADKIVEILRDPDFDCDLKNYLLPEEGSEVAQ